jgi:hypothetical protein
MGVLTMFTALKEKNYIVFANEKDKAGMVRFNIEHCDYFNYFTLPMLVNSGWNGRLDGYETMFFITEGS